HELSAVGLAQAEEVLVFVVRCADIGDTRHLCGQRIFEVMAPGEAAAVPTLRAETIRVDGIRSGTTRGAAHLRRRYTGGGGRHCLQCRSALFAELAALCSLNVAGGTMHTGLPIRTSWGAPCWPYRRARSSRPRRWSAWPDCGRRSRAQA